MIYSLERHEAHCLNRTAAFVFKHSDGRNTVRGIAAQMQAELRLPADDKMVWQALDRLDEASLLAHKPPRPCGPRGWSRREALLRVGAGLAVLAPVVTSVLVPSPAEAAATCVPVEACPSNIGAPCYRTSSTGCGLGCYCYATTVCTSGCCDGSSGNCSY